MIRDIYFNNIKKLLYGSALSHLIPILCAPILTRLFTPDDFGQFGLYLSLVGLFALAAGGCYHLAILLPEEDAAADTIKTIALFFNIIFCIFLCFIIYIFKNIEAVSFIYSSLGDLIYLMPLSVLSYSLFDIINYSLNRIKKYDKMKNARISRSFFSQGSSMFMGFNMLGPLGLVFGNLLGNIIPTLINIKQLRIKTENIKKLLYKYNEFPLYQMPTSILNTFSNHSPIYFFTYFFTIKAVGFYALVQKLFSVPIGLISSSVSQVFYKECCDLYKDQKSTKLIYYKTLYTLVCIALPVSVFLFLFSESIVSFIFGKEWSVAGRYIKYLSPAFFMRFIVSPLSTILIVQERIKLLSLWKISYFITSAITLYICCVNFSIDKTIIIYSCHEVALYLFYLILQIKSQKE